MVVPAALLHFGTMQEYPPLVHGGGNTKVVVIALPPLPLAKPPKPDGYAPPPVPPLESFMPTSAVLPAQAPENASAKAQAPRCFARRIKAAFRLGVGCEHLRAFQLVALFVRIDQPKPRERGATHHGAPVQVAPRRPLRLHGLAVS